MKYRVAMGVSAIVIGSVTGCSSSAPAPPSASTSAAAPSFHVGECIEDIKRPLTELKVVDCAKPHADEVFGVFVMPDGPFPGAAAVQEFKDKCDRDALAAYSVAEANSPVQHTSRRFPDEKSWATGDRSVVCMVASDPPTTGSVRGKK